MNHNTNPKTGGGRIVEMECTMQPTSALRALVISGLPGDGRDGMATREAQAGGSVEMRIHQVTQADSDTGRLPPGIFPVGSFMCGVVEAWAERMQFLWVAARGYPTAMEATVAALPHYEEILARLRG